MGTILSPEKELCDINIVDATSKPRNVQSVVAVGSNVFIKVNDNTIIVARKTNKEKWAFPASLNAWGFEWIQNALKALVKFRMVSKDVIKAHEEYANKRDNETKKRYARESLDSMASDFNLSVPKSWIKRLQPTDESK